MKRKLTKSVIGQRLIEEAGGSTVAFGIRNLIAMFGLGELTKTIPVDLSRICRELSLADIKFRDIPCDGMLEPIGKDKYKVTISSNAGRQRQRFSLAHECGHVLLHKLLPETRSYAERNVFLQPGCPNEEAICNLIAAQILMPEDEIRKQISNKVLSLGLVRRLAAEFDVSLSTAARRIGELENSEDFAICKLYLEQKTKSLRVVDVLKNFNLAPLRRHCEVRLSPSDCMENELSDRATYSHGWHWVSCGNTKRRLYVKFTSPRQTDVAIALFSRQPDVVLLQDVHIN